MPDTDILKYDLMKMACRYIKEKHPAVVGVAFMELNCRCIKLCGVSLTGRLLDSLTLALGEAAKRRNRPPRCKICEADDGVNVKRLVQHGLIWSSDQAAKINDKQRLAIGRKIFGPGYKGRTV
jgi:hypothetical protein